MRNVQFRFPFVAQKRRLLKLSIVVETNVLCADTISSSQSRDTAELL